MILFLAFNGVQRKAWKGSEQISRFGSSGLITAGSGAAAAGAFSSGGK